MQGSSLTPPSASGTFCSPAGRQKVTRKDRKGLKEYRETNSKYKTPPTQVRPYIESIDEKKFGKAKLLYIGLGQFSCRRYRSLNFCMILRSKLLK